MRLGIDATAMPAQRVGAGNYIYNLIRSLATVTQSEFLVFAKREDASLFQGFGSNCLTVPVASLSRIQRILWEQIALPTLVNKWHIDVLHSPHYTMPLAAKCRSVVTFHDMTFFLFPHMHQAYKELFFRSTIQLSAQRAKAIIADSESSRHDIINTLNVQAQKIFTVPLGVAEHFRPVNDQSAIQNIRTRYHLPEQMLLYVGVLEPRKNLPTLIRAFKSLIERGSPYSLVIVGRKGWMYQELFKTITELDLAQRIIFTGFVPEEELPLIYNAAELVIYPSIYEGFGFPVLEAMACGTPVVTTNVSSMPEVVGDAGVLVDPHNVDELCDAMQRVLTDRAIRDELSHEGIKRASLFTWERTAKETWAVYQYAMQTV